MEAAITCTLCNSLGSLERFSPNTDEAKRHARIHFIQSKMINDGITEDEILQRCFPSSQSNLPRQTPSNRECRRSLLDLCKSLIKRPTEDVKIVCNMCDVGISLNQSPYTNMVAHACTHLEVKLFQCRLCGHSWSNRKPVPSHIKRVHSIIKPTDDHFEDKTVQHIDEVSNWIKRCFSTNYPRASGADLQFTIRSSCRNNKCERTINNLCRSIFLQRSKPTTLKCNSCGINLRMRRFQPTPMSHHAAAHMDVKLFACRHCDRAMSSKKAMRNHLRVFHQIIDGNADDFNDQSEKFHSEYLDMIKRCFSADRIKLEGSSTENMSMIKTEAAVRNSTTGSNLKIERHLFYHRLVRKAVDSEGKITCSLCSTRVAAKFLNRTVHLNTFLHAEKHLQKPLYWCKVCRSPFCTYRAIRNHLKAKHALGMEKNHECRADEYHEEIMTVLSKCYAAGGL